MRIVSQAANDTQTLEYYKMLQGNIEKPYKNIKKKEANAIWDLADAGELMCRQMLEKNEKNYLVPKIQATLDEFLDVKKEIETRLIAILPKLSDYNIKKMEEQNASENQGKKETEEV